MDIPFTNEIKEKPSEALPSTQTGLKVSDIADKKVSSVEETAHEVKDEASVPLDIQPAKSEIDAIGGQEGNGYTTPVSGKAQRPVKYVESPDWLPKGWITEVRTREGGSSAGNKDKYFFDPVSKRRFRSRKEVFSFLETGKLGRYKPRPKIKPDGHISLEAKALSKRPAKLHSNTLKFAEVSPSSTPNAVVLSSPSCLLPIPITPASELLIYNKNTISVPCQPCPMFGFIYQSGAVTSTTVKTTMPLSHIHNSDASQSTGTSDVVKRPTKVRWVLNNSEGSWVPLISEDKPSDSCKSEEEQILDLNGNNVDKCENGYWKATLLGEVNSSVRFADARLAKKLTGQLAKGLLESVGRYLC
eukprot:Gb_15548 [translate_table: standard]